MPETATRANMTNSVIDLILREVKRVIFGNTAKKLIIFGSGARGIILHEALKSLHCEVAYFVDSNKMKQNSTVCGIPVHDPLQIMYENMEETFVIAAVAVPMEIIELLKGFGLDVERDIGVIFDYQSIGEGTARVAGMPMIDFFLGYNRVSDLPGFKFLHDEEDFGKNPGEVLRIVTLGGSTTDPEVIDPVEWSDITKRQECTGSWPRFLHELLTGNGIRNVIYNGGFSSYISSQEVLKLLRDGLTLKPDIVITFDGINDAQSIIRYDDKYPKFHSYFKVLEEGLIPLLSKSPLSAFGGQIETPFIKGICYGVPSDVPPVDEWYSNHRIMKAMCSEFNMGYVGFLQPGGLYLDDFVQSCELQMRTHWVLWSFFSTRARILNELAGASYNRNGSRIDLRQLFFDFIYADFEYVEKFYRKARQIAEESEYIIDLVDCLNGYPDVIYDNVHCNSKGNRLIAERIYRELNERGILTKALGKVSARAMGEKIL